MIWRLEIETGDRIYTREGFMEDPFWALGVQAMQQGMPTARISCNLGRALEYGETKCSFTVSIECPQTEACINQAGELVFRKGLEFVNDGMSHVAPELVSLVYTPKS